MVSAFEIAWRVNPVSTARPDTVQSCAIIAIRPVVALWAGQPLEKKRGSAARTSIHGEGPATTHSSTHPRYDSQGKSSCSVAGFSFDFRWVAPAELDSFGYPVTRKGVTAVPGLYFIGLNWLHKRKSGIVYGIREDAEHIARHIFTYRNYGLTNCRMLF